MPNIAEVISDVLCAAGFEDVVSFTDPLKALVAIRNNTKPAIVVTDFNMPGMSGLELLYEIDQHHPEINGVIITGNLPAALNDPHKFLVLEKMDHWPKKLVEYTLRVMRSHLLQLILKCPNGIVSAACPLHGIREISLPQMSEWLETLKAKDVQAIIKAHEDCPAWN
jgi:CheY-like chemotaxis protein